MNLNILIVDDSSTMRFMLKKIIQMSGVAVERYYEAGNGKEGLEVLEAHWIDLIMLDLNMPQMGGLEFINRVRALAMYAKLPIIVVSTESSQTRIEEIQSKGIAFIHKPFTPEKVRDVVTTLLGG
jgi:two-component system chemotaxis response regulator CheY